MKRVTAGQLRNKRACVGQVALFEATFGDSATLTKKNLLKAAAAGLGLDWFAENFLSALALRAYKEATAPAWRAYKEATALALRAYKEATAPAWRAYKEATALAWRAYKEATATALWAAIKLEQAK